MVPCVLNYLLLHRAVAVTQQSSKRSLVHTSTVVFVVGQWSEAVRQDLEAMMNVLEEVLRVIAAAESKDDRPTTWQIRVQLSSSILDLILIDTEVCVLAIAYPSLGTFSYPHLMLNTLRYGCLLLPILGALFTLASYSSTLRCVLATAYARSSFCQLPSLGTHLMACKGCLCTPLVPLPSSNAPIFHCTAADTFIFQL